MSLADEQAKRRAALVERIGTFADLLCAQPLPGETGDVAYDLLRQAAAQISSDALRTERPTPAASELVERLWEAARAYATELDAENWCCRLKYGQCSIKRCNVDGGWTPGDPADYSRATCARYRLECALTLHQADSRGAEDADPRS